MTRGVTGAVVLASCVGSSAGQALAAEVVVDAQGQQRLSQLSLFMGHQSVGENILAGVRRELDAMGGAPIRLVESVEPAAAAPGVWLHAKLGRNQDPHSKLDAFAQALDQGLGGAVDVALVKLCYIDFDGRTDAAALFDRYQRTMAALQGRHPSTTLIHVTAPLTTVQSGARAWLKGLFGRPIWGQVENARRAEYNSRLRAAYPADRVYDLAQLEATSDAGLPQTFTWEGRAVQSLVPAYTEDGGHLNPAGQRQAARGLLRLLAQLPARAPAGVAPQASP